MPIIFDIGGVVFEDIWEGIFFKRHKGLTDLFNLDTEKVSKVCIDCWDQFSTTSLSGTTWETLEQKYWRGILHSLQIPWSVQRCIAFSQEFIIPIIGVDKLICSIDTSSTQLGACSNQTAFWFERQFIQSKGLQLIGRKNMILSFEQGITKGHKDNYLYNKVIEKFNCRTDEIIYIEDREAHQLLAKNFGFNVVPFNKDEHNSVPELKKRLGSYGVTFSGD